ncbi:MAG: peptide chain release factor N(5)-glutamine methyltransferase [Elusimicrobiota bacterium]|jgi:release factor glutamine methyltransferase|nr:peptide chain release factor N(5)-glutamine methyltransferase [Elusimicrobiota bacterium]
MLEAESVLKAFGIKEPRPDIEIFLSFILHIKRSRLPLFRSDKLPPDKVSQFQNFIERRANREPAAYIIGSCSFMGLDFKVDSNVLIPRPETEILTEAVLNFAKQNNKKTVLDLCCGSGAIAVSLSKLGSFDYICASDISEGAIKIAKENALLNKAVGIDFLKSDLFETLAGKTFDIIVSNPPYISESEFKNLEAELRYEPKISLLASCRGLSFYKQIAQKAKNFLNKNGTLFLELNANLPLEIKRIFEKKGYTNIEISADYAGLDRVLKADAG